MYIAIIVVVCLSILAMVILYIGDHGPKRHSVVDSEWDYNPYAVAVRSGYVIHIRGEELPLASPPPRIPKGYMLHVDHKTKTAWLIKVKPNVDINHLNSTAFGDKIISTCEEDSRDS